MNKKTEKFHQENKEMVQKLIECLDVILNKFNLGIIPGEPEKSDALYMLNTYMDFLVKFREEKLPVFKKNKESKETAFDEEVIVNELIGLKSSISLLVKLCREKMVLASDESFSSEEGAILIKEGYCEEISVAKSNQNYFILSEKGEKTIKSKFLLSKLHTKLPTAVIPAGMLVESCQWSELYVRRTELINAYFKRYRDNVEHILFSLDESKEMVFGCEVSDCDEVKYVFAGIFDEKIDNHISQLKGMAKSGLIDELIIVISSADEKSLLVDEGLDDTQLYKITYVIIE